MSHEAFFFFAGYPIMAVRKHFPPQALETLFEAILVDDVVDPHVALPEARPTGFSAVQITECFHLCRQLWVEGISYSQAQSLIKNIIKHRDLSPSERLDYKYIRAKYKHMGFSFILYTYRHKRPFLYEVTSTLMGEVQDAFRNGLPKKTLYLGILLKVFFSAPFEKLRRKSVLDAAPYIDNFYDNLKKDIQKIPKYLNTDSVTPAQFHSVRKIISRHVSFFDTLRTLYPCEDYYKMSRFLSAINGLMGEEHDVLVEQAFSGKLNYHKDKIIIPARVKELLEELIKFYGD